MHSLWSLLLGSAFLDRLVNGASCRSGQADIWGTSGDDLDPPSWPWNCNLTYTTESRENFWTIRRKTGASRHDLITWNCFLDSAEGWLDSGIELCVDANLGDAPTMTTTTSFSTSSTETSSSTESSIPEASSSADASLPVTTTLSSTAESLPTASPFTWPSNPFTEACNVHSDDAEDCRVTTACDETRAEYPTCVDGKCQCKAMPCSRSAECEHYHQCRTDDQDYVCSPEPVLHPEVDGVCQCNPKVAGCLLEDDDKEHIFCSQKLNCTEQFFTPYPDFGQCAMGDDYMTQTQGKCLCQSVGCDWKSEDESSGQEHEFCRERIECPGEGNTPYCILKYYDLEPGEQMGYCTCVDKDHVEVIRI